MIGAVDSAAREAGLFVAGVLRDDDGSTLVLIAAAAEFWEVLKQAPEFGGPDPVDRYSARVIGAMAGRFGAAAVFPFGGPPYAPFIRWALRSGRAWQSPVGMLVHDTAGLMISYRGALRLDGRPELPPVPDAPPCERCAARPCLDACPVGALSAERGYDVAACHGFLDTGAGADCMAQGCKARRACPVSERFGRDPAQSAHHMRAFHK